MRNDRSWLAPLTGLAFLLVAIVAIAVSGGESPDPTDSSAREIIDFYADNEDGQIISAMLAAVACTLLVFFGATLRQVLRRAEGEGGTLSTVAFAGLVIVAVGLAIDATITFALVETADDIEPSAVQALSALYTNDFVPFIVGVQLFLLALGISVLRHGALPKWIGWIAVVLGVIAITPIGFASLLGAVALVAVISVILAMRSRAAAPPAAA
ncbi:MAG TPA: DUF4386 family protein [Thermoleophilaceae bacterium]|nr:DUF4386 family protein [Thermoleophilaceae bacterium]